MAKGALSAVVLAAGMSRRMGARNKLLLPIGGVALVRCSVQAVLGAGLAEVIVVTGHEGAGVEAALEGLDVRIVRNPDYERGQMTSVRAGLGALARDSAGAMICLADQPRLTSDDIAIIAAEFDRNRGAPVLVPTFHGARGNPIVLERSSLDDILSRGGNFGCKQFVSKNSDMVVTFEMPNDHVLVDLDGPEDYAALGEG